MKILLFLFISLLFASPAFSQDAASLFNSAPDAAVGLGKSSRESAIITRGATHLVFRLSEARRGEIKIVAQNSRESIVGVTVGDCDESDLKFFSVAKGKWTDKTSKIIRPLGEKDVVAILSASPVTIEKPNQSTSVALFYEFDEASSILRLFARKQESCDRAGMVYEYAFDGRKYSIRKSAAE